MCLGTQRAKALHLGALSRTLKHVPNPAWQTRPSKVPLLSHGTTPPLRTSPSFPGTPGSEVPGPDTSVSARSSRHSKQQSLEHCALAAPWRGDPCPEKSRGHVRAADERKRKTRNSTIAKVETRGIQTHRPISREPGRLPISPRRSRQAILLSSVRRQSTHRPATPTNGFPHRPRFAITI